MIKIYVVETKRVQMGDNWSISDLDAALSRVEVTVNTLLPMPTR